MQLLEGEDRLTGEQAAGKCQQVYPRDCPYTLRWHDNQIESAKGGRDGRPYSRCYAILQQEWRQEPCPDWVAVGEDRGFGNADPGNRVKQDGDRSAAEQSARDKPGTVYKSQRVALPGRYRQHHGHAYQETEFRRLKGTDALRLGRDAHQHRHQAEKNR